MNWIKQFFTSRYVKSIVRYLMAAAIMYLNKDIPIPYLEDLVLFLQEHSERLVDIITIILVGVLGTWSTKKNTVNAKAEKKFNIKVK